MKPVRDLNRLWGSFARSLRIILASVSADRANFGMPVHPLCRALGGSLCQQSDDLVCAQIHQNRAKFAASFEREIVDAKSRSPQQQELMVIP